MASKWRHQQRHQLAISIGISIIIININNRKLINNGIENGMAKIKLWHQERKCNIGWHQRVNVMA